MAQISINRTGTLSPATVEDGTSVGTFLQQQSVTLSANTVRVNNDAGSKMVAPDNANNIILVTGDTVSITPRKQAAA